jgi:hypothetical protein
MDGTDDLLEYEWVTRHPWQSWRERYVKKKVTMDPIIDAFVRVYSPQERVIGHRDRLYERMRRQSPDGERGSTDDEVEYLDHQPNPEFPDEHIPASLSPHIPEHTLDDRSAVERTGAEDEIVDRVVPVGVHEYRASPLTPVASPLKSPPPVTAKPVRNAKTSKVTVNAEKGSKPSTSLPTRAPKRNVVVRTFAVTNDAPYRNTRSRSHSVERNSTTHPVTRFRREKKPRVLPVIEDCPESETAVETESFLINQELDTDDHQIYDALLGLSNKSEVDSNESDSRLVITRMRNSRKGGPATTFYDASLALEIR